MDHFSLKAFISKTEKELMEQLNSNKATTFGNISTINQNFKTKY